MPLLATSSIPDSLLHLVRAVEDQSMEAARAKLISVVTYSLKTHVQACQVALSAFLFETKLARSSYALVLFVIPQVGSFAR